ncbi:MAG TPA: hypothetical protein VFN49_08815 [Candidatus Aquilonibacter sp.]|nr:hypothetical protein [Candidatus Aquilonibacter sp.]
MLFRYRGALVLGAFALNIALASSPAKAALDMVIAPQSVVAGKSFTDCSARAKNALTAVMQSATEAGTGSGNWVGVQRIDGSVAATGIIECHPDAGGYRAGFTCATQVPPGEAADALCGKLTAAFNAATAGYTGASHAGH